MTRVTNFGRKRKYLEAGFTTEPTSTSNEQPTSKATADGDVRPKKKRKKTKVSKTGDGNEQRPGGISPEGEKGVGGKEKRASTRQKITKKRGVAKSVHCVLSFYAGLTISD